MHIQLRKKISHGKIENNDRSVAKDQYVTHEWQRNTLRNFKHVMCKEKIHMYKSIENRLK